MSRPDSPRLNCSLNSAAGPASANLTADGIRSAIVARNSRLAWSRELRRLNSCTWNFSPPSRNDMPSMNSELATMAPAIDALTSMYWPAFRAVSAMTSSVRLPSDALSSPPTASPVLAATDSVARLSSAASGTMASTDTTNSIVCDSGRAACAMKRPGTNTSSQSSGLWRTAESRVAMVAAAEHTSCPAVHWTHETLVEAGQRLRRIRQGEPGSDISRVPGAAPECRSPPRRRALSTRPSTPRPARSRRRGVRAR